MILKDARIFMNGSLKKGAILINQGLIDAVNLEKNHHAFSLLRKNNQDGKEIDCKDKIVLPGIIDIHSHLRDLEQKEKETFETGTRAAISAGITTVFNMPNTKPPAITSEIVEKWMKAATKKIHANVGFIAGVPWDINHEEIIKMKQLGIMGLKVYPHAPLNGIDWTIEENLQKILFLSAQLRLPIFFHPAWPNKERQEKKIQDFLSEGMNLLEIHDRLNPVENEVKFINFLLKNYIKFEKENKAQVKELPIIHVCHVSSIEGYKVLKEVINGADKRKISFEVTPHHLLLSNRIKISKESFGKVLPPLRNPEHPQFLFKEFAEGKISLIGTDHAPHQLEEKSRDFFKTPSGFPGFETYPLVLLEKVFSNHFSLDAFVRASSENPARIFELKRKGFIKEGFDADLMIFEKTKPYPITCQNFHTKAKYSPFENFRTSIKIWKVFLRGKKVDPTESQPQGKIIKPIPS
ncbi:MAG: dihydroorotase [Promethearchaeota archaeon]